MTDDVYEMIIGLEVHAELRTETKIFCSCANAHGGEPNTRVCPVCLGMPGTLPVLNRRAVQFAVAAGLACGCRISRLSRFDRKNYFYPDLPKGYQITQYDHPLCRDGVLEIEADGVRRRIGITRIHLEEDAGKLLHGQDGTRVDYNRAGVPLIEIVSAPDIRSAGETKAYLTALRERLLFAGVSDCKMNEGSMRCDVNLSVRRRGSSGYGTRTEIKNINSVAFAGRAVAYEFARQTEILKNGGTIVPQTRRYDEAGDCTVLMREKESAADYRYFPEPDLPPLQLENAEIEAIRASLPAMPDECRAFYTGSLGIPPEDAVLLTETPARAQYFERAAAKTQYPRAAANLCIGEVFPAGGEETGTPPAHILAGIAELTGRRAVSAASARTLIRLCADGRDPQEAARAERLLLISGEEEIRALVAAALRQCQEAAAQLAAGRTKAKQAILGAVMRESRGCADAAAASREIDRQLRSYTEKRKDEP